jgi:hypothetical protein
MASVSPLDSTLRLTPQSGTSYLFSTSVIFNLFETGKHKEPVIAPPASPRKTRKPSFNRRRTTGKPPGHFWRVNAEKICLVSNLNLLDFSSGQKELAFNKHIEGGLGLGYRFNDLMLLGINWEHVQVYQLHDDIKSLEGRQVNLYGLPLLSSNQLDEMECENDHHVVSRPFILLLRHNLAFRILHCVFETYGFGRIGWNAHGPQQFAILLVILRTSVFKQLHFDLLAARKRHLIEYFNVYRYGFVISHNNFIFVHIFLRTVED